MAAADERDRGGRTRVLGRVRAVRWPERRSRELAVITAIFALIIVVAFPKLATGSATFAPNGRLATQSGSSGVDYHYKTPGRAAINDAGGFAWSFEPWVRIVHNAYSDGALPLWNPYTAFGAPLAADIQTAPAEPYYFPLFIHPSQRVWNLVALLRLLVGGVGCYALLRALGASPLAAFAPAVGFMLSATFVLWMHEGSMNLESLTPWLLLAILGMIRRQTTARFCALAGLTTLMCVGGQPEVLIGVTYLAIAWGLYWWIREGRRWRALAETAGAALLGGLIAAPLLWLGLQYVSIGVTEHAHAEGMSRYPLGLAKVVALGDFSQQRMVSLGIVLLALSIAGLAARTAAGVAGMWFMVFALIVWSLRSFAGLPGGVFGHFPGVHESNLRRYGEVVVPLAGAVLAAGGIQALIRGSRTAAIACTVGVLVPVAVWAAGGVGRGDARTALVFAVLTAAACWAVLRWPWLALGLAVVVFAQFRSLAPTTYTHPYDPFSPRPFAAYLQKHLQPGERVVGSGRILTPNISGAMRIADARANDALYPARWVAYMRNLVGRKTKIPTRDADSPFLDAAGVRYLLLLPGVQPSRPGFQLVYRSRRGSHSPDVWRNSHAYPKAWIPRSIVAVPDEAGALRAVRAAAGADLRAVSFVEDPTPAMRSAQGAGAATIQHFGWNDLKLRVHATGNATLITSDTVFPGWTATVDGHATPIRPANVAMRAIAVPAGDHTVIFEYEPPQFRYGVLLSLVGVLGILARIIVGRVKGWDQRFESV